MSNEEFTISIRKFLKHLGVTGHQIVEDEIREAVKNGKIKTGSKISVSAEIKIEELNVSHKLNGSLVAPD
tara:strand:- start:326 stop:535 length:210 start_codon:yes stop_codon:yes gene_type:complete